MTIPTDAELQGAYDSVPAHGDQQAVHIAGLRAVLAKWGQPQAGASGEPVAWMDALDLQNIGFDGFEPTVSKAPVSEHDAPLYTAPPPQAVREPLSDEQIEKLRIGQEYWQWGLSENVFRHAVRAVEAAHGITKAGQHGAE